MIMPDENIRFSDFVASLHVDFSTQDTIPMETDESKWKEWGNILAGSPTFVKAGCPRTDNFPNWREWGKMLYNRFG